MSGNPQLLRRLACVAAMAAVLVVAACGGDSDEESSTTTTTTTTSMPEESADTELDDNGFPVNAHVEPELGVVPDGIELDGREGTEPPEPAEAVLEPAAEAADCELQLDLEDEGNTHLDDEDVPDVEYETNPPTSGDHYGNSAETLSGALADGAYLEYPPVGRIVHALEHGRVAIQYSPDLPEADQLALKGVFDADPGGVIFLPNPDMPYDVAATAWTQLIGCKTFDGDATLDAVRAFRDTYLGQGPEPIPLEL